MPPNQTPYSSQRLGRSPATKFIVPAGAAALERGRMPFTDNSCWGIKTFFLENCKKILEISSGMNSRSHLNSKRNLVVSQLDVRLPTLPAIQKRVA